MRNALLPLIAGLAVVGSPGCARDLARASSSAIGCSPESIEVSDVSIGWSQTSWTARCRDIAFYCSGETSAQCAPEHSPPSPSPEDPSKPPPSPDEDHDEPTVD